MKNPWWILGPATLMSISVLAGPDTIIRQRAKELSNQNNVRQGVAAPAPPPAPATPTPQPTAAATINSSQPAGLGRLPSDLAAIKINTPVPVVQNQLLTQDIMAIAGANKVSSSTAAKLAHSISEALSTKALSASDRTRLVQDLNAALGNPNMPQVQTQAVLADIQAIFQSIGITRNSAVGIVDNLKAVTAEVQKAGK